MSITIYTLHCICYLPRDSLGLGTILGYLSNNIDTIFWVYYIYIFIILTSGHFTSFSEQRLDDWFVAKICSSHFPIRHQSRDVMAFLTIGLDAMLIAIQ